MSTRVSQQLEYCSMYSVEQFDKERWRYRYPVPVPVQYSCATPATIDSQTLLTAPLPSCRPASPLTCSLVDYYGTRKNGIIG